MNTRIITTESVPTKKTVHPLRALEEEIETYQYIDAHELSLSYSYGVSSFYVDGNIKGRVDSFPEEGRLNNNSSNKIKGLGKGKSSRSKSSSGTNKNRGNDVNGENSKGSGKKNGLDFATKELHLLQRRYGVQHV